MSFYLTPITNGPNIKAFTTFVTSSSPYNILTVIVPGPKPNKNPVFIVVVSPAGISIVPIYFPPRNISGGSTSISNGTVNIPLEGIGAVLTVNEVFVSALIGMLIGGLFFEIFAGLGILMVGQRAFGFGDTIIGAGLGAWFGWKLIIVILVLSFIFQLIIGIPIIIMNMYKDKDYKSLAAIGMLLLSLLITFVGRQVGLSESLIGALALTFLSFICAGIGVIVILKRTKERQNFTFLPFGPALVLGGMIVMFKGSEILGWYTSSFLTSF